MHGGPPLKVFSLLAASAAHGYAGLPTLRNEIWKLLHRYAQGFVPVVR